MICNDYDFLQYLARLANAILVLNEVKNPSIEIEEAKLNLLIELQRLLEGGNGK